MIPIPPARNTGGLARFLCSVKEPAAELIVTSVASGTFFNERLKAVSRIRVVKTNSFSNGGLAMEKVRVFPSASVSGGSMECDIGELPCFELESGRLLEMKGHRTFRNFFSANQLGTRSASSCQD